MSIVTMQGTLFPPPASPDRDNPMFERLNLDDFGGDRFDPKVVNALYGKKLVRRRFDLERHNYSREDSRPAFVWQDRMGDWRRLERLYHKLEVRDRLACNEYWKYATELWKRTVKICGKRVQSFYIQILDPPKSEPPKKGKKAEKPEPAPLYEVRKNDRSYERKSLITMSTTSRTDAGKVDPQDARHVWIWLGSPEELEFNRLRRRSDQIRRYKHLTQTAFNEAVSSRIADWRKRAHGTDDVYYYERQNFVAIENEGRSYGFIVGGRGGFVPVWAPPEKPPLFL